MLKYLTKTPMNFVLIEDYYVKSETMLNAIKGSSLKINSVNSVYWGAVNKDDWAARQLNIEKNGPEADSYPLELNKYLKDCEILMVHFAPISKELISKAQKLKLILTTRGGLENIDINACNMRNIPVINVIRNAIPVAEFTIGLMLSLTRNIGAASYYMMQGKWINTFNNKGEIKTLQNSKIGLLGMGNIGIEMAKRLQPFCSNILVWDPFLDKDRLKANSIENITVCDTKEELFAESDILSVHLRLTPNTKNIIDNNLISLMKPKAYLINTARGGLIDQEALFEALVKNKLAGAALDVFEKEPFIFDNDKIKPDNLILTPHIAGTTEDAIKNSPYLLIKELEKIILNDAKERIVNFNELDTSVL